MERGKRKCQLLTACRKRIAEANHIPFEIEECTHQGDCAGTCPKCEEELHYLMTSLDKLKLEGKPVVDDTMLAEELCQANNDLRLEYPEPLDDEYLLVGKCFPPDQGIIDDPYASINDAFVATITQQLLQKEKGNIVYSPAGLGHILEMLQAGMDDDSPIYEKVDELLSGYISIIETTYDEHFVLQHASSIWHSGSLASIKPDYIESIESLFAAEVHQADFAQQAKIKTGIDQWVSDNTRNLIQTLNTEICQDALLVVLDAIYLKAQWEHPFDPALTDSGTFHNADKSKADVEMMYQRIEEAAYAETDAYQVIHLPYRNKDYKMVLVLPKEEVPFENIVGKTDWLQLATDMREVDLYMPRFKYNITLSYKETLSDLGLGAMFDREDTFPNITDDPAHISQIQQQCVIQVAEEGSEAAAMTLAECIIGCPPLTDRSQTVTMRLDRPFAFAIQGRRGQPLFIGVIKQMEG